MIREWIDEEEEAVVASSTTRARAYHGSMILSDKMGLNCFPPFEFKSRAVIVIEEKAVRTHFQFATSLDILHFQSYSLMLTY